MEGVWGGALLGQQWACRSELGSSEGRGIGGPAGRDSSEWETPRSPWRKFFLMEKESAMVVRSLSKL